MHYLLFSSGTAKKPSPNSSMTYASAMNDSAASTPAAYAPKYPSQNAMYEGGLQHAGGGANTPRDLASRQGDSAPHSARSIRQPPSDRPYSEQGAYTEQSKQRQNGYVRDMNSHGEDQRHQSRDDRQRSRYAGPRHVQPKRLDYNVGQTGLGGQYVNQHDTVI